jgi:hypothetical protein
VNHLLKSVVREICTLRSVGTGGGRPPPVTRYGDGNVPIYSAFGLSQCSKVGFEGRWLGQSGLVGEELQGWPRAMTGMGQNQATREE